MGSVLGIVGVLVVVLVLLLVLPLAWGMMTYNGLVRLRNQVKNAWSQIDVQLKRRHDLIPNLVNTVKGYASHEKETLERVIAARNKAAQAQGVAATGQAEAGLSQALASVFALSESYPDLKANQNFISLQEELTSTENRVGFARQFYNDRVMTLNTRIESVPSNIIAGVGGFQKAEFFEIEAAAERQVPKVEF